MEGWWEWDGGIERGRRGSGDDVSSVGREKRLSHGVTECGS